MRNTDYIYKVLSKKIEDDTKWHELNDKWVMYDEDTELEWSFKPSYFNISYSGSWGGQHAVQYTCNGNYMKKPSQPNLPESYPKENLDMLFGTEGR